jgi:hypothetical protein
MAWAICSGVPITSIGPSKLRAFSGMPRAARFADVRTIVVPPASLIAASPRDPSSSEPDRTTPIIRRLACCAIDLNNRSIVRFRSVALCLTSCAKLREARVRCSSGSPMECLDVVQAVLA